MGRAQSGQEEKHVNKSLQQGKVSTRIIGPAGFWGKRCRQRNPGKTWLFGEPQVQLRAEYSGGKEEAEMLHRPLKILFLFFLPKDSDCLPRALAKREN